MQTGPALVGRTRWRARRCGDERGRNVRVVGEHLPVTGAAETILIRRRPLVTGAVISLVTVIVFLVWLVLAAFFVGAVGLIAAATARTRVAADRAAGVTSFGFGLAVGPAVYMLLAAVLTLT